jgi:hypothetical protein
MALHSANHANIDFQQINSLSINCQDFYEYGSGTSIPLRLNIVLLPT